MPERLHERLLALAARLDPPFVLLEDGHGRCAATLAWGSADRRRVDWSESRIGSLGSFTAPPGYVGAITYDLGLPPHAARRSPPIPQPLADLFRPLHAIRIDKGARRVEPSDEVATAAWEETGPVESPWRRTIGGALLDRSFDQAGFEGAVARALEYIRAGDIYQVNLSVAERVRLADRPLDVYRRLRAINPSPWMGFADFGDWQLVCGSPELLVEVRDGAARARPIAGTRKKTGQAAADAAMRRELTTDPKEAAEHVMLVDLARNDLGSIARYGSVTVDSFKAVEEYSHVMHLVSDVRARLAPGVGPWEVFRAMFPGGTITGTPKIRAMEIIADIEPVARGCYTGALGWSVAGASQWNIVIRSAVVRGGEAIIQAGAGIVADSDPTREWKESLRKAAALREAFGVA